MRASSHPALSGLASSRETHGLPLAGGGAAALRDSAHSPACLDFASIIHQVWAGWISAAALLPFFRTKQLIGLANAWQRILGFLAKWCQMGPPLMPNWPAYLRVSGDKGNHAARLTARAEAAEDAEAQVDRDHSGS